MSTDTAISEMNRLLDLSARQAAKLTRLRAELAEARICRQGCACAQLLIASTRAVQVA